MVTIENPKDIKKFLALIDFENLDKANKTDYDLKSSPIFTIYFNKKEKTLEIMPYKFGDKHTYYYLDKQCYLYEGNLYQKIFNFYQKFDLENENLKRIK